MMIIIIIVIVIIMTRGKWDFLEIPGILGKFTLFRILRVGGARGAAGGRSGRPFGGPRGRLAGPGARLGSTPAARGPVRGGPAAPLGAHRAHPGRRDRL